MKLQRPAFALLFLMVCATLVNGQRPPVDDDDFEFEGSGLAPRVAEPTPASPTTQFTPHAFGGRSESGRTRDDDRLITEASGSGLHSDDEDEEPQIDNGSDYSYVDYEYPNPDNDENYYDYDNSLYDDFKPDDNEGETEKHVVEHVNVAHAKPPPPPPQPTPEATVPPSEPTEHRTVLGSPHLPPQPVSPVDEDTVYDDDEEEGDKQSNVISIEPKGEDSNEIEDNTASGKPAGNGGLGTKPVVRNASFFSQPGILAAVVGGAVVGLLCAILLVMLIVYRMRKKDEGSYPLDEPKRSLTDNNTYSKKYNKEFYA